MPLCGLGLYAHRLALALFGICAALCFTRHFPFQWLSVVVPWALPTPAQLTSPTNPWWYVRPGAAGCTRLKSLCAARARGWTTTLGLLFLFLLFRQPDHPLVLPTIGLPFTVAQTTPRPRPTQPLGSPVLAKICILLEK